MVTHTQAPKGPPPPPCSRCDSPLEVGDLRCAICGENAPVRVGGEESIPALRVEFLRCSGCAAAASYDAKHQAVACPFCGEIMHREEVEDPVEQTEAWLPFTVGSEAARSSLQSWLSSLGFFRPGDLTSNARLESLRPLWWVGWSFDAQARISWAADSDASSRQSSWAPHSGQVELEFDDIIVSASRGLTDKEVAYMASRYDVTSARPAPEGGPEGVPEDAILEQFDVQRSQARAVILEAIRGVAAESIQDEFIPGSRFRNVHVAPMLRSLETSRLAFPAYVMAYRYRNKLYRCVVCGQDERCVQGTAPYSWIKILMTVAAVVALVLIIIGVIAAS